MVHTSIIPLIKTNIEKKIMSTLRIVDHPTVSISKSELEVLKLRGEERKMFRDNLEHAFEKLNRQGWEVKGLNDKVERLEGNVESLREENRDIRIEMENLKTLNHSGDIKQMMKSMKGLIYNEKRRPLGYENSGSKRQKFVMNVYEDPSAALENGDNVMYLFMKCEEASWANDVPEVLRYANLVKTTIENQRLYLGVKEPLHPSWYRWFDRNKHTWEDRKEMAKASYEDIVYWQDQLRRTPDSV